MRGKQDYFKSISLSFTYFERDIPITVFQNENMDLLYLHVNNLRGIISNAVCEWKKPLKFLFYSNTFCPPHPEYIKYIGKQTCRN
jgi:hypothetical protein